MGETMNPISRSMLGVEKVPIPPEEEQRLRDAGRQMIGRLRILQSPPGPKKAHEFLVGQLVGHGARVNGFMRAIRDTFASHEVDEEEDGEDDFAFLRMLRPDAFTVTEDEVCIYEVEVTSHLSRDKLEAYAELWDILDYYHSAFCRLFTVNARGDMTEVDLPSICFGRQDVGEGPEAEGESDG